MKKIGILTFHNSRNYGAVLQAYAMRKTLMRLGCGAEILDYHCKSIEEKLKCWNTAGPFSHNAKIFLFRFRKKLAFDRFVYRRLEIHPGAEIKNGDFLTEAEKYDCILVGSDQVWNDQITGNDPVYFLYGLAETVQKISYAASAGDVVSISPQNAEQLKCFDRISVREPTLARYLEHRGIHASGCCDPVMLLSGADYREITNRRLCREKYVFVFQIWESKELADIAGRYARANGWKVISNKNCVPFFLHCAPEDFLSWIFHAECIFTNSFHGTAFSLIFHRPFWADVERGDGQPNQRIIDLLNDLKCEKFLLRKDQWNEGLPLPKTDDEQMEVMIGIRRQESLNWLNRALERND